MARVVILCWLVLWLLIKGQKAIKVRLVGSEVSHVGQVEVQYNGNWGAICGSEASDWSIHDAHVICRMLGFKGADSSIWLFEGENTTTILLNVVTCVGKETSLSQCAKNKWLDVPSSCTYKTLAGIVCQTDEDPPPVQVRLSGGTSANSGRVEVRYHGAWGTVCADKDWGWKRTNAEVVCRMLGFPGVEAVQHSNFTLVKGISWLKIFHCFGNEISIANCSHHPWGKGCEHDKDIGVTCKTVQPPAFTVSEGQPCTVEATFNRTKNTLAENKLLQSYEVNVRKVQATIKENTSSRSFLVVGSASKFVVGDGRYYSGVYNTPLESGTTYTITVRAVNRAQNGERRYGDTASETLTITKRGCPNPGRETSKTTVIALAVIFSMVIIGFIVGCVAYRHFGHRCCPAHARTTRRDNIELTELTSAAT